LRYAGAVSGRRLSGGCRNRASGDIIDIIQISPDILAMANLIVRNIDDKIVKSLKRRAAKVSTADPASDAASNENDNDSA